MEIETLGQGRLHLTLIHRGQELRIEALEQGNALSGTEAGWQELQKRLEVAGVLLGSLESAPQQAGSMSDRNPEDPRHGACYNGEMNFSGHQESAPKSANRMRISVPEKPAAAVEAHSDFIGVIPVGTRGRGREWWA